MMAFKMTSIAVGMSMLVLACSGSDGGPGARGERGDAGPAGEAGSACSVEDNGDGTATITCDDGTTATIGNGTDGMDGTDGIDGMDGRDGVDGMDGADGDAGADGTSCTVVEEGNGTKTISCEDGTMAMVSDGTDGLSSLLDVTAEAPGANCADGGQRIDWGIDDDGDGILEAGEIEGTRYVCNGSDGSDGVGSLVDVTNEAPGANCARGGFRIDWGADDDGDGTLDAGEVDGTVYVCSGLCGNGVLDPGEEVDPPVSPFATISVDPVTCRWDFTGVRQLYCNGTWTWDAVSGCGQGDADMFCRLLMDNPASTATSWTNTTALDLPGFNGNQTVTGTVINVDRGVTITNGVRYKDDSLLTDGFHGPGNVIADPVCTYP